MLFILELVVIVLAITFIAQRFFIPSIRGTKILQRSEDELLEELEKERQLNREFELKKSIELEKNKRKNENE